MTDMAQDMVQDTPSPPVETPAARERLLVVEDEEAIARQLKWALAEDYDVLWAGDGDQALPLLRSERPAVMTLDLGLPPEPEGSSVGLQVLQQALTTLPAVKVIIITGNADRANALAAVGLGAYDYYQKPIDAEELKVILRRAFNISRLERENLALQQRLAEGDRLESLVAASSQMQEVFTLVRRVASSEVPVLVEGESGTGKELVARAIHSLSPRRAKPFVVINCGAIPENLLESELFGHEKGAFTGAHIQRQGKVEFAQGGTLFLDEIGELSLALQVKLLRFLQEQTIERVGGRQAIQVDARVVAATNKDLNQAVAEGTFREDLYYRLGVVTIKVPPLRDRGEDMLVLARHFLATQPRSKGEPPRQLSQEAVSAVFAHPWPGNVRELENRIKRALIMADGPLIGPADLDLVPPVQGPEGLSLKEARERAEIKTIRLALIKHGGNVTHAAAELGVSRPTLHDLIKRYGLRPE
jgi:two-component system NtrC family response regulator